MENHNAGSATGSKTQSAPGAHIAQLEKERGELLVALQQVAQGAADLQSLYVNTYCNPEGFQLAVESLANCGKKALSLCTPAAANAVALSDDLASAIDVACRLLERGDALRRGAAMELREAARAPAADAGGQPELTVWYGPMPESNGKSNFTAVLMRKDTGWDGPHVTIERSEYPDRIRYEADRVRYLIGELADEPFILDYDADKHSGYVPPADRAPATSAAALPDVGDAVGMDSLLAAVKPIIDAVETNDGDSMARLDDDDTVLWTASASWGPWVNITLGHLRAIRRVAKEIAPDPCFYCGGTQKLGDKSCPKCAQDTDTPAAKGAGGLHG